ncbi:hypothetical protein Golax_018362 [Gossypium laxum]|uniref:Uncharacterized protein n=1 Tax=Gossypium laxum TaxID=34288 RepID=A0A7J8Z340_9ROSI|nr:hypothetical protein [Gossypium laxum]
MSWVFDRSLWKVIRSPSQRSYIM